MLDQYNADSDGDGVDEVMLSVIGSSSGVTTATFIAEDTTKELPNGSGPRRVFVLPKSAVDTAAHRDALQVVRLHHPRHGELTPYLLAWCGASTPPCKMVCEVQERRHAFADTWFIEDLVEPSSALYVATPVDPAFFALRLALAGGPLQDKFVSPLDMLHRDERLSQLPEDVASQIMDSLRSVCEVRDFGPDERYYRFSQERFASWIVAKHKRVSECAALRELLQPSAAPSSSTTTTTTVTADAQNPTFVADDSVLKAKAFSLLSEYLPSSLISDAAKACGVAATAAATVSVVAVAPLPAMARSPAAAPPAKKARVEKSAALRRLEKAGPPKNNATLTAMFAKKQQQQPPQAPPSLSSANADIVERDAVQSDGPPETVDEQ